MFRNPQCVCIALRCRDGPPYRDWFTLEESVLMLVLLRDRAAIGYAIRIGLPASHFLLQFLIGPRYIFALSSRVIDTRQRGMHEAGGTATMADGYMFGCIQVWTCTV